MDRQDEFAENLTLSESTRWHVARWLSSRGHTVTVPPMILAPSWRDRMKYVDDGDMFIHHRVETKRRNLDFTCREDFPYPDLALCAKHSFDNARPRPYAYIIVNQAETHWALVYSGSRGQWRERTIVDRNYAEPEQKVYCVPFDKVIFGSMGEGVADDGQKDLRANQA